MIKREDSDVLLFLCVVFGKLDALLIAMSNISHPDER